MAERRGVISKIRRGFGAVILAAVTYFGAREVIGTMPNAPEPHSVSWKPWHADKEGLDFTAIFESPQHKLDPWDLEDLVNRVSDLTPGSGIARVEIVIKDDKDNTVGRLVFDGSKVKVVEVKGADGDYGNTVAWFIEKIQDPNAVVSCHATKSNGDPMSLYRDQVGSSVVYDGEQRTHSISFNKDGAITSNNFIQKGYPSFDKFGQPVLQEPRSEKRD